jgi:hypothetical protein
LRRATISPADAMDVDVELFAATAQFSRQVLGVNPRFFLVVGNEPLAGKREQRVKACLARQRTGDAIV